MRDREHQVCGGDAFLELAAELETHHFRDQHRHRLAEHCRFRFNPAHAPAQHTEAIDHGGVGVGADQRVGEGVGAAVFVLGPHGTAQIFEVYLVANPGAGRDHAEIIEGILPPAQKRIALAVALHLDIDVLLEGAGAGKPIDHHRVVNHQIHGGQRVDTLRVAAGLGHGGAHGGQVHHCRHTGKILHQYPGRAVLDFPVAAPRLQPGGQRLEIGFGDGLAVFPAQQVFQQHFERHG